VLPGKRQLVNLASCRRGAHGAKSWEAAHDLLAGGGAFGHRPVPQAGRNKKAPQIGACFERRTKSASPNSYIPSP